MDQRLATAYHEAGHAIVALALGVTPREVVLDARGGGATRASFARCPFDLRATRVYSLAGAAAECRFRGEPLPLDIDEHRRLWAGDAELVRDNLVLAGFRQGTANYGRAFLLGMYTAQAVVDLNWRAVETVAKALADRDFLSAFTIEHVLGVHIPRVTDLPDDPPRELDDRQKAQAGELLAAHNHRTSEFLAARYPRRFHLKGGSRMATQKYETANIGPVRGGLRVVPAELVATARAVERRSGCGKAQARAAASVLKLAAAGQPVGAPLLAELERQMRTAA